MKLEVGQRWYCRNDSIVVIKEKLEQTDINKWMFIVDTIYPYTEEDAYQVTGTGAFWETDREAPENPENDIYDLVKYISREEKPEVYL